ncbi:hypothetical protein K7I13_05820 [Brucepastera parasyntrophica]|uniref:hypothetical protein n=1 Tax=Brucepastera parasyntrophica TaxID=2880008 RepID=UPI00210CF36F|nr:hypothetical protein [Brucepastera parasyntrophica]ULQ60785.1 hypothetical protein K7I13_05820 [Brucepastera parasyntrophica]
MNRKTLCAAALLLVLIFSACTNREKAQAQNGQAETNQWNSSDFTAFGLGEIALPQGAKAVQYSVNRDNGTLTAVIVPVGTDGFSVFAEAVIIRASSIADIPDAFGNLITPVNEALNDTDMVYQFVYTNGTDDYLTTVAYYPEGSQIWKYEPETVFLNITNVKNIKQDE